jgi:16S rRNA (uracil1498-N3)-methyltransferase
MGDFYTHKKIKRPRHTIFIRPVKIHAKEQPAWVDIDGPAGHHLRQVLRLSRGDRISVIDGSGRAYLCEITEAKPSRVVASILESSMPEVESRLRITLALSLIKVSAFEHILTSCTELGCCRFVPIIAGRSVIKVKQNELEDKVRRWQAILQAAAGQCERVRIPEIEYPIKLEDWLQADASGLKIILRERSQGLAKMEWPDPLLENQLTILAGPEGGFETREVRAALDAGYLPLSLGPRILRAETAAAAAITILQNRYGDLS